MRIGSLVRAKGHKTPLGVVVDSYHTSYGELVWVVKWICNSLNMLHQSSEFEESLIVLCE